MCLEVNRKIYSLFPIVLIEKNIIYYVRRRVVDIENVHDIADWFLRQEPMTHELQKIEIPQKQ